MVRHCFTRNWTNLCHRASLIALIPIAMDVRGTTNLRRHDTPSYARPEQQEQQDLLQVLLRSGRSAGDAAAHRAPPWCWDMRRTVSECL